MALSKKSLKKIIYLKKYSLELSTVSHAPSLTHQRQAKLSNTNNYLKPPCDIRDTLVNFLSGTLEDNPINA